MNRHTIVVDVETNGLRKRHRAFEVAWWNLDTGERGQYVPPISPAKFLGQADPDALRINRYLERLPDLRPTPDGNLLRLWELFAHPVDEFDRPMRHTLAGSNPGFDARHLSLLFRRLRQPYEIVTRQPWHHRMLDLSAYARGVLGLDHMPGAAEVCALLDVQQPDHTAVGDVTSTGLALLKLDALARNRRGVA